MQFSNQRPTPRNWRLRDSEQLRDSEHLWGPRALLRLSRERKGARAESREDQPGPSRSARLLY